MIRIADRPSRLRGLLALVLLVSSGSAFAGEPLAELLRRLPPNTNAIAVIDVKALYASPLGMKQGWKDKRQVLFDESILPKNVAMIVTAAGVDFDHLGKS